MSISTLHDQSFSTYGPYGSGYGRIKVYQVGRELFVELEIQDFPPHKRSTGMIHVKQNEVVEAQLNGQAADVLRQLVDFKKDQAGLWTPKFGPEDKVIVDKGAGSPTIKVYDPSEQAFETLEKKATIVHPDACTCPMVTLMRTGCECGSVKRNGTKI